MASTHRGTTQIGRCPEYADGSGATGLAAYRGRSISPTADRSHRYRHSRVATPNSLPDLLGSLRAKCWIPIHGVRPVPGSTARPDPARALGCFSSASGHVMLPKSSDELKRMT